MRVCPDGADRTTARTVAGVGLGLLALCTVMVYLPHVQTAWPVYEDMTVLGGDLSAIHGLQARTPWITLLRWIGPSIQRAHAVSLALHLLNGSLLYLLARRCFSIASALIAVGVWWLHPLQVESVAYLAAQVDLLAVLWGLLGLLAVEYDHPVVGLLCAGLMVWTKELTAGAVLLLPAWAWCRGRFWSRSTWLIWVVAFALGLVWAMTQFNWSMSMLVPDGWTLDSLVVRFAHCVLLLLHVVWPFGLTIDHDWGWVTPDVACFVLTWLGVAWWLVRRTWGGWAIPAAVLALSPRIVLPLYEGVHEHHLPLALIGFALWGGSLVETRA